MGTAAGHHRGSDALDGFFARLLQAQTRLGAILDPLADKSLVIVVFLCLASVGLVPWPLAILVVVRDVIIISGAICYQLLIGQVEMSPLQLSKWNMAVQISFCALVLFHAVVGVVPAAVLHAGHIAVAVMTVATGLGYVVLWSRKAWQNRGERAQGGSE